MMSHFRPINDAGPQANCVCLHGKMTDCVINSAEPSSYANPGWPNTWRMGNWRGGTELPRERKNPNSDISTPGRCTTQ